MVSSFRQCLNNAAKCQGSSEAFSPVSSLQMNDSEGALAWHLIHYSVSELTIRMRPSISDLTLITFQTTTKRTAFPDLLLLPTRFPVETNGRFTRASEHRQGAEVGTSGSNFPPCSSFIQTLVWENLKYFFPESP